MRLLVGDRESYEFSVSILVDEVVGKLAEAKVALGIVRHRPVLSDSLSLVGVDRHRVDSGEEGGEIVVRGDLLRLGLILRDDGSLVYYLGYVVLCVVEDRKVWVLPEGVGSELSVSMLLRSRINLSSLEVLVSVFFEQAI